MRIEYVNLIAEQDTVLSQLREIWISAKDAVDKSAAMAKINTALDNRIRLMRCRDSFIEQQPTTSRTP